MSTKISRRSLLQSLGVGAAALPLLEADPVTAGCLATPPRRLIIVNWSEGVLGWVTNNGDSQTDFTLPPFMAALEPYKGDCVFIDKLKFSALTDSDNPCKGDSAGHGSFGVVLTGRKYANFCGGGLAGGPSLDQWVARDFARRGYQGLPSMNVGVWHKRGATVWRAAGQPLLPDQDPARVFDTLFGGAAGAVDPANVRKRDGRRSIVSYLTRQTTRFRNRLGTDDKLRVDAHLASLRDMERQLTPPALAAACTAPKAVARLDPNLLDNVPQLITAQMDLVVAAMAADATRVAVVQLGDSTDDSLLFPWLGLGETKDFSTGVGDANGHHSIAHRGGDKKTRVDTWFHEQFAYLIGKLKAEKEGGRSMLDSTVVLVTNNMQTGAGHAVSGVPWFIAGGAAAGIKTGRSLKTTNPPHNQVLTAVGAAVGANMDGFGDPAYAGELPGLRG